MRVAAGSTDVSVIVRIVDAADGTPETGVTSATPGLALGYWREGAASFVGLTESDLATLDAAHSDGGIIHINSGFARVDIPDAAFATGVDRVLIGGTITDMVVIGQIVEIGPVIVDAAAIWNTLTSALTTASTIGKLLVDNINATISSRSSHAAADVWAVEARVLTAGTNLSIPTAGDNADAVWDEAKSEHDAAGSFGEEVQSHALTTDVTGLATAAALTTVGGNVAAIKAITDVIPDEGQLTTLITNVAAILAATGTGGVVISEATRQAIADEILKRGVVNTEDTAEAASLTELILAALEAGRVGTTMTVRKTDGTTFSTKTLTLDDTADPVTGIT